MARQVICLDTNYLIRCLIEGTAEAHEMVAWVRAEETLVTPMVAWYEFLCGPVSVAQIRTVRAFLAEVIAFGEPQTEAAARLFNAAGRRRSLRVDAMIAGTAIVAGARVATSNRDDFAPFVPHGLSLI